MLVERVAPGALVGYEEAWELQRRVHAEVAAGDREDTVLLLEHPPTYTAGKRTLPHERPSGSTPVVDVDRGGKITWHGPGQLVGYPIVRLPADDTGTVDVVAYVRRLEDVLVAVCADLGVVGGRVSGRSGVWVGEGAVDPDGAPAGSGPARKVAAIGIRVARATTMHGFALNACNDLGAYETFTPCGISDAGVTSLSEELGHEVSVAGLEARVEEHLRALLPVAAPEGRSVPTPA